MTSLKAGFVPTPRQREANRIIANHKFTLLSGGSRSGKTADCCYTIIYRALNKKSRHAILRFHFNDVKRSVGLDTLPKILEIMKVPYVLNKSDWIFEFANGSEIWLGGLDDKARVEKILGNEYSTIYINEASQVSFYAYTTALTRLAENSGLTNKMLIDCNPPEKSHWLYQMFILHKQPETEMNLEHPELYGYLKMNPADNPHLPSDYIDNVLATLPERQKQRFLYGEFLEKRSGALFDYEQINRARVTSPPDYLPVALIGVDVAISHGENSDETGLISVGMDLNGEFYVLRDSSGVLTPSEWAEKVNQDYEELRLDSAVYETNQGGDMVAHTIHTINPNIVCHPVHATRGKAIRAEPLVALYEQGIIHHVGYFPELESQMTEWTPEDIDSPDRLDALVWAVTYLMFSRRVTAPNSKSPVVTSRTLPHPNGARYARSRPVSFGSGKRF